jgi:heptosyltransferase-1
VLRILIVKTSSMGDVIHALPLASDIAAAHPQAVIEWVVEESFAAIPRLHPAVARVVPVALRRWRRRWWSAATWREIGTARAALRERPYDAVIDCQGLIKSAWLTRWAHGPRFGPDRDSARESLAARFYDRPLAIERGLHAIERNRRLGAAALGYLLAGPPRFGLRAGEPQGEAAALVGAPFAALLTNASRPSKLWPDDRWQAVAAALAQRGLRCVLFWGSPQEELATRARAQGMRNALVAPRLALDQIAAVLAAARVVVGLDTGLSHLAAAVGAPTVGLFCDYDPALVGITGAAPCRSLGGVARAPHADEVIDALHAVLAASEPA